MRKSIVRVLIFCAGTGENWGNYLGIPKQLIRVHNTTLLSRTVSLVKCFTDDVIIISWNDALKVDQAGFHRLEKTGWIVETIYKTKDLWRDRTVWLLGDVFYTRGAMRTIMLSRDPLRFFGRMQSNRYVAKKGGEIFGATFSEKKHAVLEAAVEAVYKAAMQGGKGRVWQIYRSIAGVAPNSHVFVPELFREITDITDDIDTPEEYHRGISIFSLAANSGIWAQIRLFSGVYLAHFWMRVKRKTRHIFGKASKQ